MSAHDPSVVSTELLTGVLATFDEHGQGLLIQGHGLDPEAVAAASRWAFGDDPGWVVKSAEYHLSEQRRVTWCGRHGDACDMEGEQHTHWHPVRPGADPSRHYTFVWQERLPADVLPATIHLATVRR